MIRVRGPADALKALLLQVGPAAGSDPAPARIGEGSAVADGPAGVSDRETKHVE